MMKRAKHSNVEVVAPREEEEGLYNEVINTYGRLNLAERFSI